jgi:protein TonB
MKIESEQVQRWDDIIFEKRNKAYGAYTIRKEYNATVLKAEAVSIGIGALIFIIPILIHDSDAILPEIKKDKGEIVLKQYEVKPDIQVASSQPLRRMKTSVIPTRVTTKPVVDEPDVPETDEVSYTSGSETSPGEPGSENPEQNGSGSVPAVSASSPYTLAPEVLPHYDGGMEAMMKFIQKKLRYPTIAERKKDEGTVYVSFVISNTGTVTNVEIIKGISKECDLEAVRVISMMDKWKPGLQNKMPVAVKMVLPIKFKLDS